MLRATCVLPSRGCRGNLVPLFEDPFDPARRACQLAPVLLAELERRTQAAARAAKAVRS
jgi:hypothetical protein